MNLLLQISDTHFGTEQPAVVDALVRLTQAQRPELAVLCGDITQRATAAQFEAARRFCARLAVPVLAVPGNHDVPLLDLWSRLRHPYRGHLQAFGPALEPVHSSTGLRVACVNTTRPWRHKHGEISLQQIDRVARFLQEADAAQLRVVVVHQPIAVSRLEDAPHLLRGHGAALQRWAQAGADLVLGGHIHLPYVKALCGLPRPLWAVQAGTAVSSRLREGLPNSVHLLRWEGGPPGCCRIEQWDFCARTQDFLPERVVEVRPARP